MLPTQVFATRAADLCSPGDDCSSWMTSYTEVMHLIVASNQATTLKSICTADAYGPCRGTHQLPLQSRESLLLVLAIMSSRRR